MKILLQFVQVLNVRDEKKTFLKGCNVMNAFPAVIHCRYCKMFLTMIRCYYAYNLQHEKLQIEPKNVFGCNGI